MPRVIFIEFDGTRHEVMAPLGQTVMRAAVENAIPGILADCGGSCACGTCHGSIGVPWSARIPEPDDAERAMLDMAVEPDDEGRLTCQVIVTDALDGVEVRLPKSQV